MSSHILCIPHGFLVNSGGNLCESQRTNPNLRESPIRHDDAQLDGYNQTWQTGRATCDCAALT
jgi:hypothetical protein